MGAVRKYQVAATFKNAVVEWTFAVETEEGEKHFLPVRDAEEIPVLVDLCRNDPTVYFDEKTCTIRSGWNSPGVDERVKRL